MQWFASESAPWLSESRPFWQRVVLIGGCSAVVIGATKYFYQCAVDYKERQKLTELREAYKLQIRNKMELFQQYLLANPVEAEEVLQITTMAGMELLEKLRSKELNYQRVLLAYQHKAFEINKQLNCVTEFLMPDLSEVRLDGPLAGLPVSVKENFLIKDLVSCAGCSEFLCLPRPREDCVPIRVIKDLGGIPFCRTNIPQTMMSFGSSNPIYGQTYNPFDHKRTPGGSSSGEGALISAGGSPLGLGTDIGGSVRVPAAFCGIVGVKPTSGRFSRKNMMSLSYQSIIASAWGPMARDVRLVEELLRLFSGSALHRSVDFQVPPTLEWKTNEEWSTRKLRIGYFTFDGFFHASPPMVNVVEEVKTALEAAGHELIPFQIPGNPRERFILYLRSIASDGGYTFRTLLRNDAVDPILASSLLVTNYSAMRHGLLAFFMQYVIGNEDASIFLSVCRGVPAVWSLWNHVRQCELLKRQMEDAMLAAKLDAILCPAFGTVAPWLKNSGSYTGAAIYTALFNLLNYPAGVVPVRRVEQKDLVPILRGEYPPKQSMWHKNVAKFLEDSIGLPLAVQVVTPTWHDEMCLHVMKEVERVVKTNQ